MKIAVINGSPKWFKNSNTMQYVFFSRKYFSGIEFDIINAGFTLNSVSPDMAFMDKSLARIKESDAVLWAFPVYWFLVPFGLKRFIELVFERNMTKAFKNKPTASFSTSIHIFDSIAHEYMRGICDDLDMKYTGYFSADLFALLFPKDRKEFITFLRYFTGAVKEDFPYQRKYAPVSQESRPYYPGDPVPQLNLNGKKALIITDLMDPGSNQANMITRFRSSFDEDIETIVISDLKAAQSCVGCLSCAYNNICRLENASEFVNICKKIDVSDIVVFSGTIKDRFLSAYWKLFYERMFQRGHPPNIFRGKQLAFLISGPLKQVFSLQSFLKCSVEIERANLVGIVTDEEPSSETTDCLIDCLAKNLCFCAERSYDPPITSDGLGSLKIVRDNVWGRLRFLFQADHKNFKKYGVFDFPQKNIFMRILLSISKLLYRIPVFRRYFLSRINPRFFSFLARKLLKY